MVPWTILKLCIFFSRGGVGGSKAPSFFSNKRRHHDITATVKDNLSVSELCLFYQRPYYLRIYRSLSTFSEMWILLINWTTWRHNDVRLRHIVSQVIPRRWMSTLPIVCNFGGRRLSGFQVIESRKPKKPSLNKVKTWYNTKLFNIIRLFLLAKLKCYLFLLI